ncbi:MULTISPECIES: DUF6160 family protein [Marinobacter]|uniref:DUF6160 family protein n=1 Tax=Marinobacter TaxID=2742 RepID=UPI001D08E4D6|nr:MULTISPECIES: DUF6160 family protein [Marinobacter]MCG8517845.1 DUF6160 family protein [Pseudomonadales bacterium]MCK7565468.1 DUF6160 family protein [Marinobacter xestospongiae]UDL06388.1 hypothetical protein J2887_06400 [Marinobacter sp. CA1]
MKSLKISTLVLATSMAPLVAQAELQALNDQSMGQVTGQSGITIELEAQVQLGEFRYEDEGSLAISDIFIGGADRDDMFPELGFPIPNQASTAIDNIKIDIDIMADGDAVFNVLPLYGSPVDFAIRTGKWELIAQNGPRDGTVLMDNVNVEGVFGSMRIVIDNQTEKMNVNTRFAVDKLEADVPFLAMGIRDMQITGAGYGTAPGESENVVRLFAMADFDIYKAPNAAGVDALALDINSFDADMHIGALELGGTSIGAVHLDDLSVYNTSMRIYGH